MSSIWSSMMLILKHVTSYQLGTALIVAVEYNKPEIAKYLVERGADVKARNANDSIALHIATWHGRVDLAKVLVAAGAEIDAQNKYGDTPLHRAAEKKKPDMVKYLVLQGADVNLTNNKGRKPGEMTDDDGVRMAFDEAITERRNERIAFALVMNRFFPPGYVNHLVKFIADFGNWSLPKTVPK